MSKQSEAKERQGFRKDSPCCQNCLYFSLEQEKVQSKWSSREFIKEGKFRCNIGGFKTLKRTWCNIHEFKENYPLGA